MRVALALFLFVAFGSIQGTKPSGPVNSPNNSCDWVKTQLEMTKCSDEQYRKADARLNALYTKTVGILEKNVASAKYAKDATQTKYNEAALQKLREAERVWIQYRDLHCDAAKHEYEDGSMSSMVWTGCMKEVTEHRIEELRHAYESGDAKPD
jgi:uncharacterized protein YecT (DUF1311 family)